MAKKIALDLLIIDGFMYEPVGEPRYTINCLELGSYRSTAIFVDYSYCRYLSKSNYFTALEHKDVCKRAGEIAIAKGDTSSMPVLVNNDNTIDVLIAGAVRLNPKLDHGDGSTVMALR